MEWWKRLVEKMTNNSQPGLPFAAVLVALAGCKNEGGEEK